GLCYASGRALAGALGNPVGLVIPPGVAARLVVTFDPQRVVIVVAGDPRVGNVALRHPGVRPVAGNDTGRRRGDVHRLRDNDDGRRRGGGSVVGVRILPAIEVLLPRIRVLQAWIGILGSRVGVGEPRVAEGIVPGRRGLLALPRRSVIDRDPHAGRAGAGRNSGHQGDRQQNGHDLHVDPSLCSIRSTRVFVSPFTSILSYRDAGLDSGPHQLGPSRITDIGRVIAVAPDELASRRNL